MSNRTPDRHEFPPPHEYATYIYWRSPSFKTHTSLSQAKNAVSGKADSNGVLRADVWVYEWSKDEGEWIELHHLTSGSQKKDHVFFQTVARKKGPIKGPSQKQIDAAIASIASAQTEQ